jgi:hypothetical protein
METKSEAIFQESNRKLTRILRGENASEVEVTPLGPDHYVGRLVVQSAVAGPSGRSRVSIRTRGVVGAR